MTKIVPASMIPLWQREAVLMSDVKWVVVRNGYIDSGHRTIKQAEKAAAN